MNELYNECIKQWMNCTMNDIKWMHYSHNFFILSEINCNYVSV